jgi:hypothetical protein
MLFSTLVIGMTAIVLGLVGAWFFSPALRRWMEEPKYRMLRQEGRFDAQRNASAAPSREPVVPSHGRDTPPSRNAQDNEGIN